MGEFRKAAVLVLVACVFFAAMSILGKAAQIAEGPTLHPLQITWFRYLLGALTLLPFVALRGAKTLWTPVPARHALRLCFGISGVTAMFAAIGDMPLADATAINWSAPLFAVLFAAVILREAVDARRWIATAVGFLGVLVLVRPTPDAFQWAALIALLSALCGAAEVTVMRRLATIDPPLTTTALVNIGGALAMTVIAYPVAVWPSPAQAAALIPIGIAAAAGQLLFIRALGMAEQSALMPYYYSTLLHVALAGVFLFGEPLTWPVILGGGVIVAAGAYLAMARKTR